MSNLSENEELNVPRAVSDEAAVKTAVVETAAANKRRRFLARAGMAGVGMMGATQVAANAQAFRSPGRFRRPPANTPPASPNIDIDVLNFALNLEYLEAEFYLRAAFGRGLSDSDVTGQGTLGGVSGGRQVPFTSTSIQQFAQEIALDEEAHVRTLRAVLGSNAIARPTINIDTAFTLAARAAGIIGPSDSLDVYSNQNLFLLAAFVFEDVGVTAYKGGAPLLTSKAIVEAAAGFLAVEAYHAGLIRAELYARGLFTDTQKISDARDSLDGADDRDQGITLNGRANIVPTDGNGLAFSRTTSQVLSIVYLGGPIGTGGGFLPNGANGRFR